MKKRILSFLLSLIMLFSLAAPATAFADADEIIEEDGLLVQDEELEEELPSDEDAPAETEDPLLGESTEAEEELFPQVDAAAESDEKMAQDPDSGESDFPEEELAPAVTEDTEEEEECFVRVSFLCSPEETALTVYAAQNEEGDAALLTVEPEEDGSYLLAPGEYFYSAAAEGYLSCETVPFTVTDDAQSMEITIELIAEPLEEENGEEEAPIYTIVSVNSDPVTGADQDLPDSEELFSRYVDRALYPANTARKKLKASVAGDRLSGAGASVYSAISPYLPLVASGERASTVFEIPLEEINFSKTEWTAQELGLAAILDENGSYSAASEAMKAKVAEQMNFTGVINALLADNAYAMYWYDKTAGAWYNFSFYYSEEVIGLAGNFTFSFSVAEEFAAGECSVNTEIGRSVQTTVQTARQIVEDYAGYSDRAKLDAYRTEICSRVSYNNDALRPGTAYGNPWQLIWVFDDDPATNVVCEGYSKAFQYLCDLSTFSEGTRCITASGGMNNGAHMWNIVRLSDGFNYLVDVTNCDGTSAGAPDKLFLVRPEEGSLEEGYAFLPYGYRILYQYDEGTLGSFGEEDLKLYPASYRPISASGTCGAQGDNVRWTLYQDGELFVEGTGAMADYPSAWNVNQVKKVTVAEGVTAIGAQAFFDCDRLTEVTLPSSVTDIGYAAFSGCSELAEIVIPESVTSLGANAFAFCASLTQLTIPGNVKSIGRDAFYSCSGLQSVTLSSGIEEIGAEAFGKCAALKTIVIPESVTSISSSAFSDCAQLTVIEVLAENPVFSSVSGVLFDKNHETLLCCPAGKSGSYDVPVGVTRIGDSAFAGCVALTAVSFPVTLTELGLSAFRECSGITGITLPEHLSTIGGGCFSYCSKLASISLPTGLEMIGNRAFAACAKLTDIYYNGTQEQWAQIAIGEENEELGSAEIHFTKPQIASGSCGTGVKWTLFEDGELVISGSGAMKNYSSAANTPWSSYRRSIQAVRVEEGITAIGNNAFAGFTALTQVSLANTISQIGSQCFSDSSALTELTLPQNLSEIGSYAFMNCSALSSIEIPEGVEEISSGTFMGCAALSSISLPEGLGVIRETAFDSCVSLEAIALPDGLTMIGDTAFYNCSALRSIHLPSSLTTLSNSAFWSCSMLEAISAEEGNAQFASADGVLFSKDLHTLLLFPAGKGGSYTIPEETQTVGSAAFRGCQKLTALVLPEGLTRIENNAFYSCAGLASVSLPSTLNYIGSRAFYNCDKLTDVYYGDSQEQWLQMTIEANNAPLTQAAIHYTEAVALAIIAQPADFTGKVGDTVRFTVEATGEGLTYQWQYLTPSGKWVNSGMTGNKTATLSMSFTEARLQYSFRCIVTDGSGDSAASNTVKLLKNGS